MGRPAPTTLSDLAALPATLPVWRETGPSAASVLNVSRTSAWAMAQRGELPVIRCGRSVRVVTTRLLEMLGEKREPTSCEGHPCPAGPLRTGVESALPE